MYTQDDTEKMNVPCYIFSSRYKIVLLLVSQNFNEVSTVYFLDITRHFRLGLATLHIS